MSFFEWRRFGWCGKMEFEKSVFVKHNTSPNQRLSLIILLTVRVQELIKAVKFSMKGGIF